MLHANHRIVLLLTRWLDELPEATTEDVGRELDRLEQQEQRQRRRNGA
ncbi:hypothetical protein [Micromonospora sp. NPDC023633]